MVRRLLAPTSAVLLGACAAGDQAPAPPTPAEPDVSCAAVPAGPVDWEVVDGIVSAEDFVFEGDGGLLSLDPQGNLVRSRPGREPELVAPAVTSGESAGVSMLPNGDVAVADVGTGSVLLVHPDGGTTSLLSGLRYPNGLEVHPDGWIAVAEQEGGQVVRIDPDSMESEVVVDGLFSPNGVTFSPDGGTLYVNSFGGGTLHAVPLTGPEVGEATLLGSVPMGDSGAPPWGLDPWSTSCIGLDPGDACTLVDQPGTCLLDDGWLYCEAPNPFAIACRKSEVGDPCAVLDVPGVCQDVGWGEPMCDGGGWFDSPGSGGLDGIAADVCDQVYVTQFDHGKVWRWGPEGGEPELMAELPDVWIPNMDFGVEAEGWGATTLWVMSREEDRLYGLDVGVPGRPRAHLP